MLGYAQVAVSAKLGWEWKEVFAFLGLSSIASGFIISMFIEPFYQTWEYLCFKALFNVMSMG